MSRFDNRKLDNFDVMEHIKNIYDILGTFDRKAVTSERSGNVTERLNELQHTKFAQWSGTREEYEIAKASGLITPDMLCAITDDYVEGDYTPKSIRQREMLQYKRITSQ